MHQNFSVGVNTVVETVKNHGLVVSKEQYLALVFMKEEDFLRVRREINDQTRKVVKTTFNQSLIERLFVIDLETRQKAQELFVMEKIDGGSTYRIISKDYRKYSRNQNTNHVTSKKSSDGLFQQKKPYRRDNKDLEISKAQTPLKQTTLHAISNASHRQKDNEISTISPNFGINIDTLNDKQIDQLLNTGSSDSIKAVLRDSSIVLSHTHVNKLREQLKIVSSITERLDKKDTIIEREGILRVRTNQSSFRAKVLKKYRNQCVITGINILAILEAAHVIPADGNNDQVNNSLLLSKNMHGLFDRFLISINPETNQLVLSPSIKGQGLDEYNGKVIEHLVLKDNLIWHYMQFLSND
ncbi:HNH endonuclease [Aliivibrio fischeri]|uniref:HNH endonuclease n=1 Tax=Aliivibrio fischeri TaxID=668 RepID=UPI00354C668A